MPPKPFAFVLMPFGNSFRDTYHLGIKPACEEAGYYCERLDEQMFEETMLDRIYNQISKADLIVADMSERNPNVFYETGYAHALGKRVILLTRNADDIPFDLKHHHHIIYSDGIVDLKRDLTKRASFYFENPGISNSNPFTQLCLLINSSQVDLSVDSVAIAIAPFLRERDDYVKTVLPLEFSFHLLETSTESDVDLDVRLITPSAFFKSGWDIGQEILQDYTSIPMPDGTILHKPLNNLRINLGDPDVIAFDLFPHRKITKGEKYLFILRIISLGLIKDLKIEVSIS